MWSPSRPPNLIIVFAKWLTRTNVENCHPSTRPSWEPHWASNLTANMTNSSIISSVHVAVEYAQFSLMQPPKCDHRFCKAVKLGKDQAQQRYDITMSLTIIVAKPACHRPVANLISYNEANSVATLNFQIDRRYGKLIDDHFFVWRNRVPGGSRI